MQFQTNRDPESTIVAIFKNMAAKNESKTAEAGRPIFDDIEVVELHYPGSKNFGVYPTTAFSHWGDDPSTGERVRVTYAERFRRQYMQFKQQMHQTTSGTPLAYATFLTEGKRAELRALNVYTIEALAAIDGQELKNLGPGGRDWKNKAMEYLADAVTRSHDTKLVAELEKLRSANALMQEDLKLLKERVKEPGEDEFDSMSLDQLRDFITANTGQAPQGAVNRKTLARMARQARPDKAA